MRIDEKMAEFVSRVTEGKKVAVCLSGGLDSTTVLYEVSKSEMYIGLTAYTVQFGTSSDDGRAKEIADYYEVEHKYIPFENLWDWMVKVNAFMPKPHYNVWPAAICSKAKEDGCDIILTGEGADEIFGYPDRGYFEGWASQIGWINPVWEVSADLVDIDYYAPWYEIVRYKSPECFLQFNQPPFKNILRDCYVGRIPKQFLRLTAKPPAFTQYNELLGKHFGLPSSCDPRIAMRHYANLAWSKAHGLKNQEPHS